jgi:putative membrane protein
MNTSKKHKTLITLLSVVIPLTVVALFGVKLNIDLPIFLPPVYATINAFTAFVLVGAVLAIKNKNRILHQRLMTLAIGLSVLFLILYVTYHMTSDATHFGGEGFIKYLYYFVLVSHIILSITVIPLVLVTFSRALLQDFNRHKKIARFAFPLWLYVAVSGVLVYILIAPYY